MTENYERIVQRVLEGGEGVVPIFGDASTRSYYRVHVNHGSASSLVAMKLASDPLGSDEIVDGERPKDIPFLEVASYLRKGDIPVPEVVFVDRERGVILLEDLGDMTVERALARGVDKDWLYLEAVRLLARLHAYAAENPDSGCIAFRRSFGERLLRWELDHFREWLLETYVGAELSRSERSLFDDFRDDLARRLSRLPKGFVHRDYQSRNLMLRSGRLFVIDFQDALEGPYVYDIVALLRDSYVAFTRGEVKHYLAEYLALREASGLWSPTLAEAYQHFQLQALQRKLKDAGRFVYIDRVRGNPKFLGNIPRSLAYAREAFESLPEYGEVFELVSRYLGQDWGKKG